MNIRYLVIRLAYKKSIQQFFWSISCFQTSILYYNLYLPNFKGQNNRNETYSFLLSDLTSRVQWRMKENEFKCCNKGSRWSRQFVHFWKSLLSRKLGVGKKSKTIFRLSSPCCNMSSVPCKMCTCARKQTFFEPVQKRKIMRIIYIHTHFNTMI